MVEQVSAAVGVLVALSAVVVSALAHRHQVRRAELLDRREQRVEERERRMEAREAAAERRLVATQASLVHLRITQDPSPLHQGWVTARLHITNGSNQPLSDLRIDGAADGADGADGTDRAEGAGSAGGVAGHALPLEPGRTRSVDLPRGPLSGSPYLLQTLAVEFTDVAGIRWRRSGDGGLHRGQHMHMPEAPAPAPRAGQASGGAGWTAAFDATGGTGGTGGSGGAGAIGGAGGVWVWGPRESPAVSQGPEQPGYGQPQRPAAGQPSGPAGGLPSPPAQAWGQGASAYGMPGRPGRRPLRLRVRAQAARVREALAGSLVADGARPVRRYVLLAAGLLAVATAAGLLVLL